MPKDFGDWFGDAKPLDFNDPTPEAPKPVRKSGYDVLPVNPDPLYYKCDGNHGGPPCADPQCWSRPNPSTMPTIGQLMGSRGSGKSVHQAVDQLRRRGFKPDIAMDCMRGRCRRCGFRLDIPAIEALDYLQRHMRNGTDPELCISCNALLPNIKRFP